MARSLRLPRPDDFHAHLRSGPALAGYARREAASFGRALVMPNILPPVADAMGIAAYRGAIMDALSDTASKLEPLMTFKLLSGMTAETVRACARAGAVAGKYYPAGATTNSADGIRSPREVEDALAAMEEEGLVLSIHGEDPAAPVLERETAFLPTVEAIMTSHPRLRVALEHLSGAEALAFVLSGPPNLAGTLTAHHLSFTLDDLLGEGMDPHLFCKPIVKTARDRAALRAAAFSGERRLFFGSDSAPHPRAAKENRRAPAGIYAAPTALAAIVGLFFEAGAEAALRPFLCENGAAFYGLPPATDGIILVEEAWTVPEEVDGSVPMFAGKSLAWRVVER